MDLVLDLDSLTLGDVADLEDISGRPFAWWIVQAEADDPEPYSGRDLIALAVVTRGMTVEQARGLKLGEVS